MAKIENREVLKRIERECFLHPAAEAIPNQLGNAIVPVIVANPEQEIKIVSERRADDAYQVIFTANTKKRTFIDALHLAVTKDAFNNSTYANISVTPKGQAAQAAINILLEPTTAAQGLNSNISFKTPIEIEKGSIVTLNSDAATASIDISTIVYYHEVNDQ